MKIVINGCFGGFGISNEVYERMGEDWQFNTYDYDSRTNADLIAVIEDIGSERASGVFANLIVVDIPDDATDWRIEEYDGNESVWYVLDGKMYEVYQ